VFLFGFAKSERDSLDDDELAHWQRIGCVYLGFHGCGDPG
jgi:hypothetical protein